MNFVCDIAVSGAKVFYFCLFISPGGHFYSFCQYDTHNANGDHFIIEIRNIFLSQQYRRKNTNL